MENFVNDALSVNTEKQFVSILKLLTSLEEMTSSDLDLARKVVMKKRLRQDSNQVLEKAFNFLADESSFVCIGAFFKHCSPEILQKGIGILGKHLEGEFAPSVIDAISCGLETINSVMLYIHNLRVLEASRRNFALSNNSEDSFNATHDTFFYNLQKKNSVECIIEEYVLKDYSKEKSTVYNDASDRNLQSLIETIQSLEAVNEIFVYGSDINIGREYLLGFVTNLSLFHATITDIFCNVMQFITLYMSKFERHGMDLKESYNQLADEEKTFLVKVCRILGLLYNNIEIVSKKDKEFKDSLKCLLGMFRVNNQVLREEALKSISIVLDSAICVDINSLDININIEDEVGKYFNFTQNNNLNNSSNLKTFRDRKYVPLKELLNIIDNIHLLHLKHSNSSASFLTTKSAKGFLSNFQMKLKNQISVIENDLLKEISNSFPRPVEVLLNTDDFGNVVEQRIENLEEIEFRKFYSMQTAKLTVLFKDEYITYLTGTLESLRENRSLVNAINKDLTSYNEIQTNHKNVNIFNGTIWSLCSLSYLLPETEESEFYIEVLRNLLSMASDYDSERTVKAFIASSIIYVIGCFPRFFNKNRSFLKTVIKKLGEFMIEKEKAIRTMSCEVFLKIVNGEVSTRNSKSLNNKLSDYKQLGILTEILKLETKNLTHHQRRNVLEAILIVFNNLPANSPNFKDSNILELNSLFDKYLETNLEGNDYKKMSNDMLILELGVKIIPLNTSVYLKKYFERIIVLSSLCYKNVDDKSRDLKNNSVSFIFHYLTSYVSNVINSNIDNSTEDIFFKDFMKASLPLIINSYGNSPCLSILKLCGYLLSLSDEIIFSIINISKENIIQHIIVNVVYPTLRVYDVMNLDITYSLEVEKMVFLLEQDDFLQSFCDLLIVIPNNIYMYFIGKVVDFAEILPENPKELENLKEIDSILNFTTFCLSLKTEICERAIFLTEKFCDFSNAVQFNSDLLVENLLGLILDKEKESTLSFQLNLFKKLLNSSRNNLISILESIIGKNETVILINGVELSNKNSEDYIKEMRMRYDDGVEMSGEIINVQVCVDEFRKF